jgi:hypothetical protein
MRFNRPRYSAFRLWLSILLILGGYVGVGCDADVTDQDEVFPDARQGVEQTVLPAIVDESEAVLRNLMNFLAALPEICATPLAALGSFTSSMPSLGRPSTVEYNDDNGRWRLDWQDVVLGDDDDQLTVDTTTPRMDILVRIFFRSQGGVALRAIPFSLAPQSTLLLAGEPPSYAGGATEGFFLSQDAANGQWRLRWRALDTAKVFEGTISAESGVSGVVRRIVDGEQNTVASLDVNTAANTITFSETTQVTDEKGITFFVRPGERVRFRLSLGTSSESLAAIRRDQLRLGVADQLLPAGLNPENFLLGSSLPIDPTGAPVLTPGTDQGTFIWQDVATNACSAGEDQWRLRFSSQTGASAFTGTVRSLADENQAFITSAQAVGSCPAGDLSDSQTFSYNCTLSDNALSGYDLCVTTGRRLTFTPRLDQVRDPRFVFIGGNVSAAPSPLPFSILFDIEMSEQQSDRNLRFSEAAVVLEGNTEEIEDEQVTLNVDQVSFDPLCRIPGELVQPRVRFTGEGEYATARFEGSAYRLDQVRFTETQVDALTDIRRFPDSGEIRLFTRVEEEIENSRIRAFMQDVQPLDDRIGMPVDVELNVNDVLFTFLNQNVFLSVE